MFLAACDSDLIGRIFRDSGVDHVICIKSARYVLDEAAIKFTKHFYKAIFEGQDVNKSFKNAQLSATLQFEKGEVNLFTLHQQQNR